MRRWFSERLDNAMFPLLKFVYRGYHRRLAPYRPAGHCDLPSLARPEPPGCVALRPEGTWRGFAMEAVWFDSPQSCTCEQNRTVHGRLITADPAAPWVLIVPGYATGALPPHGYSLFQNVQGYHLLRRGLNVALLQLPFHMARRRPGCGSGEGFFSPDLAETMGAFQQAAADGVALVRWLQARSGRPVGLWGTSLGGNVAGLVTTLLGDLGAVVLMEPLDNPGDTLAVLPGSREIREALRQAGVEPQLLPQILGPLAPSRYAPAIGPERILFVTPLWDRVIPARFQEAFWQAWGRPARIAVDAGHLTLPTDRALNEKVADFMAGWLLGTAT
ncbi:MAG TPA: hypothetical protein VD902_12405 [Symbiobacteriaceae bacterium]|nr:hypothetical protein [Symbiobacteriaceae bacterium]